MQDPHLSPTRDRYDHPIPESTGWFERYPFYEAGFQSERRGVPPRNLGISTAVPSKSGRMAFRRCDWVMAVSCVYVAAGFEEKNDPSNGQLERRMMRRVVFFRDCVVRNPSSGKG